MCHLFASQCPDSYAFETRSIRLNGQSTSIRLERVFWEILEDIAAAEGMTVPRFISTLHQEICSCEARSPISPPICAASASALELRRNRAEERARRRPEAAGGVVSR